MNRAAARLHVLYPNVGDQTRVAEEKGIDQGYVSRLFRSARVPGTAVRRLFWEGPERIPMHWWDEEVGDGHVETELEDSPHGEQLLPPPLPDDDEPTRPELPVLLGERRQSSFPPPPPAFSEADFQEKSRAWFDRALITDLPPVAPKFSERDRADTDPDPRAGDVLEPTPKPLTVHDRDFE